MKPDYKVIGVMAGSSMDGLDIALTRFYLENEDWRFEVLKTEAVAYPDSLYDQLKDARKMDADTKEKLDISFGSWIGDQLNSFKNHEKIDLLAIHGHTVEHTPDQGISWQLGDGQTIANHTGIPTVSDFRRLDVSIGGQGAPLVPFGDFKLFSEFDFCLNLGGIANVSWRDSSLAWDICPCNQVLNFYARKLGHEFDENGELSRKGAINEELVSLISQMDYFHENPPKSLPNDFIPEELLDNYDPNDGLRSYTHFISKQLAIDLSANIGSPKKMLITGGGAFNGFLIEEITKDLPNWHLVLPSPILICFKEAIIFGFLGLMRQLGLVNVLSTVTGGRKDTSSGVIHLPK